VQRTDDNTTVKKTKPSYLGEWTLTKARDKREARKGKGGSNVKRAATERRTWEPPSLILPPNASVFYLKDAEPKRLDILNYCVGKGNPKADEGQYYYERRFWIHKGYGPDGRQSFVCTSRTFGKKCAGCDYVSKLQRDPEADPDLIRKLLPKERQLLNVIDKKDADKGVQIWETSYHSIGKLLEMKIQNQDDEDNYQDFADWEGGLTIKCDIEDDKVFGRSVAGIEFKQRADYDAEDIESKVYCLDNLIKEPSYAEQQKIVMGMEEESEETESTKKSKEVNVKKIKSMTEKELKKFCVLNDIELDWDDLDTLKEMQEAVVAIVKDAAEDEKSSKKSEKKTSKKVVEEDDNDDEDEDEEVESDDDEDEDDESDDDDEDEDEEVESDDDEDEDDKSDDDDEDTDDDDDDEDTDDEDTDDDDDDEDDDDEDEPPVKKRGRPKK